MTTNFTQRMTNKVPEITLVFWIAKILTTGMGEVFSDFVFFNKAFMREHVLMAGAAGLILTILIQLVARRYIVWRYWLAVVAVSIFGTMFADYIHDGLDLDFMESTILFLSFQLIVFLLWYRSEKTLSITSIFTRKRELFYWATVLGTFALGTAAGDFTADGLGWGTFDSGLAFTALILVPAIGYRYFHWNSIFSFWFAYIMTRPLGASFSDWMARDLKWGTGPVSLALTILIVLLVGWLAYKQAEQTPSPKRFSHS